MNKKAGRGLPPCFSRSAGKKARFDNLPCLSQMRFRKKGWMLILEATIAVLIISGVLITVYSKQTDRRIDPVDYYDSLQGQILADVSERSDLRLNVLNVEEENFGDGNFVTLYDFIGDKIPSGFGYSIRVCVLGNETDYCRMEAPVFIATMDEEIYVEEIIVSAELGMGADALYNPKKLRLFVWEGESFGGDCNNTCLPTGPVFSCSADFTQVLKRTCGNFDDDYCLEWEGEAEVFKTCVGDEECAEGLGICAEPSNTFNLTCERKSVSETGCVYNYDDECNEWNGGGRRTGDCGNWYNHKDAYECYNIESVVTECLESPVCPSGYSEAGRRSCTVYADEVSGGAGTIENPFLVENLEVDIRFASQGAGDGEYPWTKPHIIINGVKVGETTGYGNIFEKENYPLAEGKNVVELYSNWGDWDGCGESPYADAVLAVLRIDDKYVIQTDESWMAMLVGKWSNSVYQAYSKSGDGGCYMGSGAGTLINFPWTNKEKCVNSRACGNCCYTRVKKEFYVHKVEAVCVDTSWTPSPSDRCVGETFTQISNCGTTRSAVGTKNCVASLGASASAPSSGNMGTTTHFSYISTISETGGNVGATINSRQKCYSASDGNEWCDSVKYTILPDYGTNYIVPNGQISDPLNYVDLINGYSYTVTEAFKGTDDNGNGVQTSYSFSVTA